MSQPLASIQALGPHGLEAGHWIAGAAEGPEVHLSSAGKADDPPSADHGLLEIAALMVTAGFTPDAT